MWLSQNNDVSCSIMRFFFWGGGGGGPRGEGIEAGVHVNGWLLDLLAKLMRILLSYNKSKCFDSGDGSCSL